MSDTEDAGGDEPTPARRIMKIITAEEHAAIIQDPAHNKVVCVAWLKPTDKNCNAVLTWLKKVPEDPFYEHVLILQCDPQSLSSLACDHQLFCVPTFHFYWHDAKLFTFTGSNELKFRAYIAKTLQARHAELSIPKAWQRVADPERLLARGEPLPISPDMQEKALSLGVGWTMASSDDAPRPELFVVLAADGGKAASEAMLLRTDNLQSPSGAVSLQPSGTASEGDDILLQIAFDDVEVEVWEIYFILLVPEAREKELGLANVGENFYLRAFDTEVNRVFFRYDIEDDAAAENAALIIGKLIRDEDMWTFHSLGEAADLDSDDIRERFVRLEKKKKKKK